LLSPTFSKPSAKGLRQKKMLILSAVIEIS